MDQLAKVCQLMYLPQVDGKPDQVQEVYVHMTEQLVGLVEYLSGKMNKNVFDVVLEKCMLLLQKDLVKQQQQKQYRFSYLDD